MTTPSNLTEDRPTSGSRRPPSVAFALAVVLVILAFANLFPLGYMIALSARGGLDAEGAGLPAWGGPWRRLFVSAPLFGRWFVNSFAVVSLTIGFHVIADAMAAYVLAKRRFRGRTLVFVVIILAMMVPRQVTLIPLFLSMSRWGLADTFAGLILPGLGDVVGIFLLRQFMMTLPDSLLEAARVDGASHWSVFRHIVLPLSRPALAVMAVLAFQHYWSDFFWPMVIIHDASKFTLQVGLASLVLGEFGPDLTLLAAGGCAVALPILVFFFIFRRTFFAGVRVGAIR